VRRAAALVAYLLIAVLYTWPLLPQSTTRIAGNAYDPILTTSILWWNATNVPFTDAWWNPPYYYPDHGVMTFSENLVGVSVFASPIYWLTHNPLTAHNVSLYLAWPLSAFGVYLLVEFLTRRRDAAFLAGLAFGFTPYRTAELGHIQMVSSYWFPLALLGLHRYLDDRRVRWLVLFGAAFLLQALANGYMLFYGGILIAIWLAYFGSRRELWRSLTPIFVAGGLSLLALVPVMLRYRAVHDEYDMHRVLDNFLGFSLPRDAWAQVSGVVWLWRHVFPDGDHNLFPGAVMIVLMAIVFVRAIRQPAPGAPNLRRAPRWMRMSAWILGGASLFAVLYTVIIGPWRVTIGGNVLRMTNIERALAVCTICTSVLLWPMPRLRAAFERRSFWLFYAGATIAMAILSCGPELRVTDRVMVGPAPYAWLLALPGFNELRVPTRFWMLGVMCLGIAAGLSFVRIVPKESKRRLAASALVAVALVADGWMYSIPMADPPAVWPVVEAAGVTRPILELPLGPEWDTAATFRSISHRRPVYNGASGYEPQHYAPLLAGLAAHDPDMLPAIATLGSFDVVIDRVNDPDGEWTRYVTSSPGVTVIASAARRTAYRVPAANPPQEMGPAIPIVRVESFNDDDTSGVTDGRYDTEWRCIPQEPGRWVSADLGAVRDVGGVSQSLGGAARDFPRGLAIDVSIDGVTWDEVWHGSPVGEAFRAAAVAPLEATMHFSFAPRPARFVRLRLTASHQNFWRVVELQVHAPAGR
jgi:hypothetical protein